MIIWSPTFSLKSGDTEANEESGCLRQVFVHCNHDIDGLAHRYTSTPLQ